MATFNSLAQEINNNYKKFNQHGFFCTDIRMDCVVFTGAANIKWWENTVNHLLRKYDSLYKESYRTKHGDWEIVVFDFQNDLVGFLSQKTGITVNSARMVYLSYRDYYISGKCDEYHRVEYFPLNGEIKVII